MARTKASVGAKVSYGKSSKAQKSTVAPSPKASSRSKASSSKPSWSGGNAYCPRDTPNWQQPITRFFGGSAKEPGDGPSHDTSTEERTDGSDGEAELSPLVDDDSCHKMDEFYPKMNGSPKKTKNKGVGKNKKANKENAEPDEESSSSSSPASSRKRSSDENPIENLEKEAKRVKI